MAMTSHHTDISTPLWIRMLPQSWQPYMYLARYDRPVAIWILFLPCLWAFVLSGEALLFWKSILVFFVGSILMRGAGCIINDMADQKFDRKVGRTMGRPLAKESLSNIQALTFLAINLVLALLLLLQFNGQTILLGFAVVPLVVLYPFTKRWTHWPQLVLGLVFNWGVLMAWSAMGKDWSLEIFLLYGAAVLWTLGYDTIYGHQDREEDVALRLKSTAILFHGHLKLFLGTCFGLMMVCLLFVGVLKGFGWAYYGALGFVFFAFLLNVFTLEVEDKSSCLRAFRAQKFLGLLVLLALVVGLFGEKVNAL